MVYAGVTSQFSEGDAIGVYAVDGSTPRASNVKFTLTSGVWVAESKVPYNPYYRYYAYYPYSNNPYSLSLPAADLDGVFASFISDSNNRFWSADQSTKASFDAANLMIASTSADGSKNVAFTMLHKRGLAVIDGVGNTFAYASDPSTSYPVSVEFNGNIPYAMDSQFYFLMKPGQSTNFAGLNYNPSSGKYSMNNAGIYSMDYSIEYSYSLDNGSTWSSYSSTKPDWITISSQQAAASAPVSFSIGFSDSKLTDILLSTYLTNDNTNTLKNASAVSNVDLSLVDCTGNSCAQTTANCYMVHAPGTYRLPLVYGNSIVNDYDFTESWGYHSILVNHLDNGITNPWIKNNGITISSAKLIWQDVKGMISSVGIDGDYLTFTVSSTYIAEGNAVISAVDSDGKIAWSWHIWVTPETLEGCETIIAPSSNSRDFIIAPVNVGWVTPQYVMDVYAGAQCKIKVFSKGSSVICLAKQPNVNQKSAGTISFGYSPYYQWGRSIPEPPSDGTGNTTHTVWDIDGNVVSLTLKESAVSIGTTIQNPLVHYCNSSTNSPYDEINDNLWDSGDGSYPIVKSVYDPCPPGFCITGDVIIDMGNGYEDGQRVDYDWDDILRGKTWTLNGENVFFPASGYRESCSTLIIDFGSFGHLWSATMNSGLGFSSDCWFNNGGNLSEGRSIRPAQDKYVMSLY